VTNPDTIIEVEHLWTRRGGLAIHRDLNLKVVRGEIVGMVAAPAAAKPRCCA